MHEKFKIHVNQLPITLLWKIYRKKKATRERIFWVKLSTILNPKFALFLWNLWIFSSNCFDSKFLFPHENEECGLKFKDFLLVAIFKKIMIFEQHHFSCLESKNVGFPKGKRTSGMPKRLAGILYLCYRTRITMEFNFEFGFKKVTP